ncbi:hypothetical protein [Aquimarina litoralis]|uniref:hypothetical protein n=1 Tax=Aquimarina litoralis TaxID=584605 RepID=UPI001C56C5D5|nr:hypothetical protein [Aquimarina litoralis]MBW1298267.1 hypothetical protein [Aquimarina litoralis]
MKKKDLHKLSLDKIKIARLTNARAIKGGSIILIEEGDSIQVSETSLESINDQCTTSTKTVPIGTGSIDANDI